MIMTNSVNTNKSAMHMALTYLSRGQMSVAQLRKRLQNKGYTCEEIEDTVNKLCEWKYVDDYQYTLAYIKSKRDKYSKRRTMVKLLKVGVPKEIAVVLLDGFYEDDLEEQNCLRLARKIWDEECIKYEKKRKDKPQYQNITLEILVKKKVGDKLLMRGFPLSTVNNVLNNVMENDN